MSAPWMKFYPSDWRADPALRMCSVGARGLWMEMLCVMHEATPRGSLVVNGRSVNERQLAGLAGCSVDDVASMLSELEDAGVFSREEDGTIFSRRMRRDDEKSERDKANGKAGGHPDIRRGTVPKEERVRRFRRSDSPAKAKRIFDRSSGECHWCRQKLDPDNYHIDHVIAVRDGGTNDEANLVVACPDCNGERAMTWGRNDTDLMVGINSDHKAQKPEARVQKNYTAGAQAEAGGPTRADLDRLEDALRAAAGPALNAASPGLLMLAPILNLISAGVDLEQDILPAVRQVVARPSLRRGSVRSWEFFTEPIREAHARRIAVPSPLPEVTHERSRPARQNPHDLMLAALAAECAGGDGGGRTPREDPVFGGPH